MNRFHSTLAGAALAISVAGIAPTATAAPITFDFTATYDAAPLDLIGAAAGIFNFSDPLSGSFTFDDSTIDADASAGTGSYLGALTSLSFTGGGGGSATNGDIRVKDAVGSTDAYTVFADMGDGLTGVSSPTSLALSAFTLALGDFSGTGFSSDLLPSSPPALADFPTYQSITLGFSDTFGFATNAKYDLTSLTLNTSGGSPGDDTPISVSEPASLLLLLAGMTVLGASRLPQRRR